jgi:hypothetical protein
MGVGAVMLAQILDIDFMRRLKEGEISTSVSAVPREGGKSCDGVKTERLN